MKRIQTIILSLFLSCVLWSQDVRFAFMTDLHLSTAGGGNGVSECIADINAGNFDFVIVSGDIVDFGTDADLEYAKTVLDALRVPYYAIPGNHDSKWSESGATSFARIFGSDTFCFTKGGWRFVGCPSGPTVRMAPGLIPRESLQWLESLPQGQGTIFINHYPIDDSILNYRQLRSLLARLDVRFVLGGHVHKNQARNYGTFPGALCRACYETASSPAGYSIVEISGGEISITERRVFSSSEVILPPWLRASLLPVQNPVLSDEELPDVNKTYPHVRETWRINEVSDIAAGFATGYKDYAVYGTLSGLLKAVSTVNGALKWETPVPGKVFSTPVIDGKLVYVGCTDGCLYAFNVRNGKMKWKFQCGKAVLGSPAVMGGKVFFGASDGSFRALDAAKGSLVWEYKGLGAFVECRPFVDARQVVFGAWDGMLYSLNTVSGTLMWTWKAHRKAAAYSPAACWPVKSAGRIFIAAPDRRLYAIDALTGVELFHVEGGRESVGLSSDGNLVFVKTMQSQAYALRASMTHIGLKDSSVPDASLIWKRDTPLGYDIAPTSLVEHGGMLLIPSDKGVLHAFSSSSGDHLWSHRISYALVNPVTVVDYDKKSFILASTMDGAVVRLDY